MNVLMYEDQDIFLNKISFRCFFKKLNFYAFWISLFVLMYIFWKIYKYNFDFIFSIYFLR